MNPKNNLGREVRRQRMALRVSQMLAAQRLGRSQKWLSLIESGRLAVTDEKAERILAAISRIGQEAISTVAVAFDFSDLRFKARRPRSKSPQKARTQQASHRPKLADKREVPRRKNVTSNSEAIQKIGEIAERLRKRC